MIRGIGHYSSTILGSVVLSIDFDGKLLNNQKFIVVKDSMITFCFILGLDCLSANDIKIDYSSNSRCCLLSGHRV